MVETVLTAKRRGNIIEESGKLERLRVFFFAIAFTSSLTSTSLLFPEKKSFFSINTEKIQIIYSRGNINIRSCENCKFKFSN